MAAILKFKMAADILMIFMSINPNMNQPDMNYICTNFHAFSKCARLVYLTSVPVFHLALSNMAQRYVAFCERHVALHERHAALLVCHVALRVRHVALLIFRQ